MSPLQRTTVTATLVTLLAVLTACSINETDVEELGALSINAMDTTLGITLEEGQVLVGGVPRANRLPATFGEVPAGEVEVTVRPGMLYPPATRTVTINPPETTFVQVNFSANDAPASVTVEANQADAAIIVDEQLRTDLTIGSEFQLGAGRHEFSVFKPGHKTMLPALQALDLAGTSQTTLTFTLEPLEEGTSEGQLFPDFALSNDAGDTTRLAEARGHVTLISFWFYDCQPCRDEFPEVEQTFRERAQEGVRVLAINVGWYQDGQDEFEAIRDQLGLTFPLVFNDNGPQWTAVELGIQQAPTNFVLSRSGEVLFRRGQVSYESLNQMIDAAFAEGGN